MVGSASFLGDGNATDAANASVEVMCGSVTGVFLVSKLRILVLGNGSNHGTEVSPTEFEKLGGRAATKKWKQSIRLINSDGGPGRSIGEWLQAHNIDTKVHAANQQAVSSGPSPQQISSLNRQGSKGSSNLSQHSALAGAVGNASAQFSCWQQNGPSAQLAWAQQMPRAATPAQLQNHQFLLDPDMYGELMTASDSYFTQECDDLMAAAAMEGLTAPNSWQASSRGREDSLTILGEYIAGTRQDAPLHLLGSSDGLEVCGKGLNLRTLYHVVKEHGGYDNVRKQKQWPLVIGRLGYDANNHQAAAAVCSIYERILLRCERQESALSSLSVALKLEDGSPMLQSTASSVVQESAAHLGNWLPSLNSITNSAASHASSPINNQHARQPHSGSMALQLFGTGQELRPDQLPLLQQAPRFHSGFLMRTSSPQLDFLLAQNSDPVMDLELPDRSSSHQSGVINNMIATSNAELAGAATPFGTANMLTDRPAAGSGTAASLVGDVAAAGFGHVGGPWNAGAGNKLMLANGQNMLHKDALQGSLAPAHSLSSNSSLSCLDLTTAAPRPAAHGSILLDLQRNAQMTWSAAAADPSAMWGSLGNGSMQAGALMDSGGNMAGALLQQQLPMNAFTNQVNQAWPSSMPMQAQWEEEQLRATGQGQGVGHPSRQSSWGNMSTGQMHNQMSMFTDNNGSGGGQRSSLYLSPGTLTTVGPNGAMVQVADMMCSPGTKRPADHMFNEHAKRSNMYC